ncbi:sensor histidine kinase [Mucilaginibacter myungsuensis]|uniref:Histidine kinase n=1 Tax=Mucilaginibacter myungsuensis TaxID=649104 RepID=A0A929KYY3_9SPHI|nr:histidine kinase [Mucilaginibacter myungsuensis]MBE9661155.1 histidine kinase [Mucilaginibacter myungsuensis]MDN3597300.1 histidine kinase [Mucilaginibacter myungsuensis]
MRKTKLLILSLLITAAGTVGPVNAQDAPKQQTQPKQVDLHNPPATGQFVFYQSGVDTRTMIRARSYSVTEADKLYTVPYSIYKDTVIHIKEKSEYIAYGKGIIKDVQHNSPIMLGVKVSSSKRNYGASIRLMSKIYPSYLISDNADAEIVAMGINKGNVNDFRYRVVQDDSIEVVHWSKVPLDKRFGAMVPYGAVGNYKALGKLLMVEVVNVKDYSIRDGVILDWRKDVRPLIEQIYLSFSHTDNKQESAANITSVSKNRGYAKKFINGTTIPADLKFPADSVSSFRVNVKPHSTVPYRIIMQFDDGKEPNEYELAYYMLGDHIDIQSDDFEKPGKYKVIISPLSAGEQKVVIPFEVTPPPLGEKKVSIKQILPYTIATLSGVAFLFFIYRRRGRIRLARSEQEKQVANLKLNSVRSQLNPHFMFNALTSIQNLMNQQDTEGANHYLSKFAGLTRQVLSTSAQELVSLADELKLMTDYLQMEQLRFGFEYDINVDAGINQANTDMPNMLLQPFIENAAKHGVSALQSKGKISVNIIKQQRDLVLTVADNGPGFGNGNSTGNGVGVKISKERIDLLNQIYKDQPILMNIDSTTGGATITITLTNWL